MAITGISSMATRLILNALSRRYEGAGGQPVKIEATGGVTAADRVRAGEALDIVVLASKPMAKLEAEGHIVAGSIRPFTRSGMAIAAPAGRAHPDVGSEAAVKRAVLEAGTVCYSTGPSGDHVLELCARWGIGADSPKLLKAPPGVPVGQLVAEGKAGLGFQQLSELIHVQGIDILGPLPPEIQATTIFSAGVCSRSGQVEETRKLIDFLVSPATDALKRDEGMEPPPT
jgi:molybdate transport system substrate-binding protein